MSYGGSVQAMINSLKNNRLQSSRRKERVKNVKDYFRGAVVESKSFNGKEVSKEELERIKKDIRIKAKKRKTKHLIVKFILLVVFILFFLILITFIA